MNIAKIIPLYSFQTDSDEKSASPAAARTDSTNLSLVAAYPYHKLSLFCRVVLFSRHTTSVLSKVLSVASTPCEWFAGVTLSGSASDHHLPSLDECPRDESPWKMSFRILLEEVASQPPT